MKLSLTTLITVACAICFLQSQAEAKKEIWITVSNTPTVTMRQLQIKIADKIVEHRFSKRNAGRPLVIPDHGLFQIVRENTVDGKKSHEVIANIEVGENVSKALVILAPIKAEPNKLQFKPHIENLKDFDQGDKMFINLSENAMQIHLGENILDIDICKSAKYKGKNIGQSRVVKLAYKYRKPDGKVWNDISMSNYLLQPNTREIIVFYTDTKNGRYDYYGVSINMQQ